MIRPLIAVVGPTAAGKTACAVATAALCGGEIVSADSRQIYRGMDVGTGKDIGEYGAVAVHMLDIVPAGYRYNLFEYIRDAGAALDDISSRGRIAVVCGGTGMYVENLLKGIVLPQVPPDPGYRASLAGKTLAELTAMLARVKTLHNTTDTDTPARAIRALEIERYYASHPREAQAARNPQPRPALIVGVDIDRDERRRRITARLHHRLEREDMLGEVRRLLDSGIPPENLIYYGLEYKYLTEHLLGLTSYDEMFHLLETAIHQFAKRQMTWFRGMERRGFHIEWLSGADGPEVFAERTIDLYRNKFGNV